MFAPEYFPCTHLRNMAVYHKNTGLSPAGRGLPCEIKVINRAEWPTTGGLPDFAFPEWLGDPTQREDIFTRGAKGTMSFKDSFAPERRPPDLRLGKRWLLPIRQHKIAHQVCIWF